MSQFSLFAADAAEPVPDDLAGVLAGHGQSTLSSGSGRISVVVVEGWRAEALADLARGAGLTAAVGRAGEHLSVVTEATPLLAGVVGAWRRGAVTAVPPDWTPAPGQLRAWTLASGRPGPSGEWDLGIDAGVEHHAPRRTALVDALGRAGIPARYVGPRGGGPALRLTTAAARAALVAVVGAPPDGVPTECWPR